MPTPLPNLSERLTKDAADKREAFFEATLKAGITLPDHSGFLETLQTVFGLSDFVARGLTHNPELLQDLIKTRDLERKYKKNAYAVRLNQGLSDPAAPENEKQLSDRLRDFRLREALRIAWRDLAGWSNLEETMSDLSALADACLDQTLSILNEWQCIKLGTPHGDDGSRQSLVVIGMGKLGGMELNFSSDIDLIFSYPLAGSTQGGPQNVSNEDFFTRLSRQLIRIIGETTTKGWVFRVDMRLRPYGESGPLVMNFDAMEEYYQRQGREWERYAWIKARIVAGEKEGGTGLLQRLKPFIYRKYLDYGIFESLRDMKQKIAGEVARKGMEDHIKLGPGGIREIEFFAQVFQLTRGGVFPALQEPRIREALSVIARERLISQDLCDALLETYHFLRNTEHRLQEFSDQQTHKIPKDPLERHRLSVSMGFSDWASFETQLRQRMKWVHDHFNRLLGSKESEESGIREQEDLKELAGVWKGLSQYENSREALIANGFKDPEKVTRILDEFKNEPAVRAMSNEGIKRLDRVIPSALKQAGLFEHPDIVLTRIIDLIKTILGRINYLALLMEHPAALVHLARLAEASPWIISFLAQHPVLLDELLDPRTLYTPPEQSELQLELRKKLDQIPPHDLESKMIEISIFRQINTLRVAAADVMGALPLMRVSDHLTEIAETVLKEVLDLATHHLNERHGTPECLLNGVPCDTGFCMVAYGKLGGFELGYGSDLDLVFLHAGADGQTKGGPHPLDNSQFFSRLGQRIIHILTTPTPAGALYDVDMRLRPDGSSGILVVNIDSFEDYQKKKAWTWEHQALIKARAICGDPGLRQHFEAIRQNIIALPRQERTLRKEVAAMRLRMQKELLVPDPHVWDIKQGSGGLVDIEFLVQYLTLLNAREHAQLAKWTDVVRLLQTLADTGIIDDPTRDFLTKAYLAYRSAIHKLSLQEKPAKVAADSFAEWRKKVIHIRNHCLGTE